MAVISRIFHKSSTYLFVKWRKASSVHHTTHDQAHALSKIGAHLLIFYPTTRFRRPRSQHTQQKNNREITARQCMNAAE